MADFVGLRVGMARLSIQDTTEHQRFPVNSSAS
jgi:hypothetical protein